jgi:hypothetical protein
MINARINKEKLLTIRSLLPHGANLLIAKKVGCTHVTVSRVLNGKSDYPGVIEEALRIIGKRKLIVKKAEEVLS